MKYVTIDLLFGASAAIWGIVALLYIGRRPEELSGMSHKQFRILCFGIITVGIVILVAAPFIRK